MVLLRAAFFLQARLTGKYQTMINEPVAQPRGATWDSITTNAMCYRTRPPTAERDACIREALLSRDMTCRLPLYHREMSLFFIFTSYIWTSTYSFALEIRSAPTIQIGTPVGILNWTICLQTWICILPQVYIRQIYLIPHCLATLAAVNLSSPRVGFMCSRYH